MSSSASAHDAASAAPAGGLLLAALLFAAFVMRGPVTAVGPVAEAVREWARADLAAYGLITALPVAAFGGFSFLAPALVRRCGLARGMLAALLVLVAGAALRLVEGYAVLLAATLMIGAGIALLNVMAPVVVKSAWAQSIGSRMGLYTGMIGFSGAAGGLLSAPLLGLAGTLAGPFGFWAGAALAAALLWTAGSRGLPQAGAAPGAGGKEGQGVLRELIRNPLAWCLTAVMGLQSLLIYTAAAWMPVWWQRQGMSPAETGVWIFVFLFSGLPASMFTARFFRLVGSEVTAEILLSVTYLAGFAGWLAGGPWMLPASIAAGAAQGAMLSAAFLLMAGKSPDGRRMLGISSMAQGIGYLGAGLGPWVFAVLLEGTGGWGASFAFFALVIVLWAAAGLLAARRGTL